MKRNWSEPELEEYWSLSPEESHLISSGRNRAGQLGFALQLKFLLIEGKFPLSRRDVPAAAIRHVAEHLGTQPEYFSNYELEGRSAQRDRKAIRKFARYRESNEADKKCPVIWLCDEILPRGPDQQRLEDLAAGWLKEQRVEAPDTAILQRLVKTAIGRADEHLCTKIVARLSDETRASIDELLNTSTDAEPTARRDEMTHRSATLNEIKADPRRPSLESMFDEVAKLERIDDLTLPKDFLAGVAPRLIDQYRRRVATEPPSDLRVRVNLTRYAYVAIFCWQRRREILDGLVELLIHTVHRIGVRAEHSVEREMFNDFKRVRAKSGLLFKLAETAVDHPDGVVQDVIFPVVGEQTLRDLVKEFKSTGPMYRSVVHTVMRASYSGHYRRMLPLLLDALPFRCNNDAYRPIMTALELLQSSRGKRFQYFEVDESLPIKGVIMPKWHGVVLERDQKGNARINRINYEICVLQSLREALRSKEIWIEGADRFRNPDEDLPSDFREKRDEYYAALNLKAEAKPLVDLIKTMMKEKLKVLNDGMLLSCTQN